MRIDVKWNTVVGRLGPAHYVCLGVIYKKRLTKASLLRRGSFARFKIRGNLFPDLQFQGLSGGITDDVDASPEAGSLEAGLEVRERRAGVQADIPEFGAHQVEYPVAACGPRESARGSGGRYALGGVHLQVRPLRGTGSREYARRNPYARPL